MIRTYFFSWLFLLLLVSCNQEQAPPPPPPRPVPVLAVTQRDVVTYSVYPAEITGTNNNEVRPKISGYIQQVYVDEGQRVRAGQPLFKLETNVLSENAQAAQAQVGAAEASIEAAKANVNAAQVEVDKLTPLVNKGIISPVQLETARANLLRAQSELTQAQANRRASQANYQSVRANINFSTVVSPINGVVGKLNFRKGSLVSPNDPMPITTVSDAGEVYAYFTLSEKEYLDLYQTAKGATLQEKIKNFPEVELELANGALYDKKGRLEATTGQIDPNTGTIQLRVIFNNRNGLLSNGSTGNIRVPLTYDDALVIPEAATYEQQGFVYAYRVDQDTARQLVVQLKGRADNLAIIESGLQQGDTVVAAGVASLRDGTAITPQPVALDSLLRQTKKVM